MFPRVKLTILILLSFAAGWNAHAALSPFPATNETWITFQAHSFYDDTNRVWGDAIATYGACMYPQYTNHFWNWSRSGTALEGNFETDGPRRLLPFFAAVSPGQVAWNIFMAGDDNGAYTSNEVVQWSTNIMCGPYFVWNGAALTNEGITFPAFTNLNLPIGGPPEDTSSGGGANQIARNNAATNVAGTYGLVQLDVWHLLWNNGWSSDVTGARKLGFFSGNHLYPAGYLCMALQNLIALGAETNIGNCVIDFNAAALRSTNHMVVSSVALTGGTLSWNVHFDRMPGAWDTGAYPTGCDDAFAVMPYLANSFNWIIQVTNLPAGNYDLAIDANYVLTLTDVQLAGGWNMFPVTNGPLWAQRLAVLNAKRDQEGVDHATRVATHGADSPGVGGNNDLINYNSESTDYPGIRGTTFITAMSSFVAGMKALDKRIYDAAQQTNHTFTLTRPYSRAVAYHR
jgi:hypothetical protein